MIEKIEKLRKNLYRFYYRYNFAFSQFILREQKCLELYKIYKEFYDLFLAEQIDEIKTSNLKIPKGNLNYIAKGMYNQFLKKIANSNFSEVFEKICYIPKDNKIINNLSHYLLKIMTLENKQDRERALYSAEEILYELIPLQEDLWKLWKNYNIKELIYENSEEVSKIAEEFISQTEEEYQTLFLKFLKYHNLSTEDFSYTDYIYYLTNPQFNALFEAKSVLDFLIELLNELKLIHLISGLNIIINANTSENKKAIEYTFIDKEKYSKELIKYCSCPYYSIILPIIPRSEINVFLPAYGNFKLYEALLFSVGKAAVYSSAYETLPFEYIYYGDSAIEYGYAYLFNFLLFQKEFWRSFFIDKKISDEFPILKFSILQRARETAAAAIYENKLINYPATEPLANLSSVFSEIFKTTLNIVFPSCFYLLKRDIDFTGIQEFKGLIYATTLFLKLNEKYGREWFKNKKAGSFLAELIECGKEYNIKELIKDLRFPFSSENLLEYLRYSY